MSRVHLRGMDTGVEAKPETGGAHAQLRSAARSCRSPCLNPSVRERVKMGQHRDMPLWLLCITEVSQGHGIRRVEVKRPSIELKAT